MDWPMAPSRCRWRWHRRTQSPLTRTLYLFLLPALVILLLTLILSLSSTSHYLSRLAGTLNSSSPNPSSLCGGRGDRFLFYAPHSGFSNQVGELKNAILFAAILNRTLIVPPVLDHHAVALGSCPKFRVSSPTEIRTAVWDHVMDLVRDRRYVSMGDIIDLSSLASSRVRMIDFRMFASTWCRLNMESVCFSGLCCSLTSTRPVASNSDQCRLLLSGLEANSNCVYAVEDDCRTTVWTYNQKDNILDSFQPDLELQKKKKISYVRKRRDLLKALGPGTKADTSTILAFGTLFTGPYKGSELYIDIHEAPGDLRIQSLLKEIEFLPFVPEIIAAGKDFALNNIKKPFLCAQLRLLDGQFKNHWKTTFSALKQKLDSLKLDPETEKISKPINIFLMTDLPIANWTGTYLADLAKDTVSYKLLYLHESSDIIVQAARRLMTAEHGLRSGFLPKDFEALAAKKDCKSGRLPDILLHVEESVCSCASLGFVGTAGSTIAENIELMRKNNICKL